MTHPQAGAEKASAAPQAAARKEPMTERTSPVHLGRVAAGDVRLRSVRLREVRRHTPGDDVLGGAVIAVPCPSPPTIQPVSPGISPGGVPPLTFR